MQIQHKQNLTGDQTEDTKQLLRYITGKSSKMPRLDKGQQREILMLTNLGLKNYEIQYLMHLKNKEKLEQKWKR